MCTRFVYNGEDMITGFNFEIDLSVWKHKVIMEKDRSYIGIQRPDGMYHSYHGVNRNGNAGTLLYVHENPAGRYLDGEDCMTIADLTEQYIRAEISFDEVLQMVKTKRIVYAPDADNRAGYRLSGGKRGLFPDYELLLIGAGKYRAVSRSGG